MQYMLLIYNSEALEAAKPKAQVEAEMGEYFGLGERMKPHGIRIVQGEALHPVAQATTVEVRAGKTLSHTGPFAETKEQLGGFYLIECADLEGAIAFAAAIPGARDGWIEIRPVVTFE
jgi:hypothetical protein